MPRTKRPRKTRSPSASIQFDPPHDRPPEFNDWHEAFSDWLIEEAIKRCKAKLSAS
jgi:hypothetical protein